MPHTWILGLTIFFFGWKGGWQLSPYRLSHSSDQAARRRFPQELTWAAGPRLSSTCSLRHKRPLLSTHRTNYNRTPEGFLPLKNILHEVQLESLNNHGLKQSSDLLQFRRPIFVSNLQGTRIFDEVLFSIQTLIHGLYERLNVYICASYLQ